MRRGGGVAFQNPPVNVHCGKGGHLAVSLFCSEHSFSGLQKTPKGHRGHFWAALLSKPIWQETKNQDPVKLVGGKPLLYRPFLFYLLQNVMFFLYVPR